MSSQYCQEIQQLESSDPFPKVKSTITLRTYFTKDLQSTSERPNKPHLYHEYTENGSPATATQKSSRRDGKAQGWSGCQGTRSAALGLSSTPFPFQPSTPMMWDVLQRDISNPLTKCPKLFLVLSWQSSPKLQRTLHPGDKVFLKPLIRGLWETGCNPSPQYGKRR